MTRALGIIYMDVKPPPVEVVGSIQFGHILDLRHPGRVYDILLYVCLPQALRFGKLLRVER